MGGHELSLDPCSRIGRFGLRKREALAQAEVEWDAAGVLERFSFTDQAAKVMTRAQRDARSSASGAVETEHELLALLGVRDGISAEVFGEFGITIDPVRALVVGRLGPGPEHPIQGQMPFSALAKNVLEVARREALSAGSQRIDPEHLLLGIVGTDCGACQILQELGADAESVRLAVQNLRRERFGAEPPAGAAAAGAAAAGA
jgi:ATP-dependent Clp protease ATP-binding subunit ClpC